MKKVLLAIATSLAFSTALAKSPQKDVEDLYMFQIVSDGKVLTEFEQKVTHTDLAASDFSYQHKTKYYKDCRDPNSPPIEVDEGATGLVTYDESLDLEMLHISFDVNASRKIGLCQEPKMENFEISLGFPFLLTSQRVKGTLGNEYTVNAGKIYIDKKGKVVYPKF